MADGVRGRDYAWGAVSVLAAVIAVIGVGGALWQAFVHGDWGALVTVPLGVLFYWWIGAGAWRRTTWSAERRRLTPT